MTSVLPLCVKVTKTGQESRKVVVIHIWGLLIPLELHYAMLLHSLRIRPKSKYGIIHFFRSVSMDIHERRTGCNFILFILIHVLSYFYLDLFVDDFGWSVECTNISVDSRYHNFAA